MKNFIKGLWLYRMSFVWLTFILFLIAVALNPDHLFKKFIGSLVISMLAIIYKVITINIRRTEKD